MPEEGNELVNAGWYLDAEGTDHRFYDGSAWSGVILTLTPPPAEATVLGRVPLVDLLTSIERAVDAVADGVTPPAYLRGEESALSVTVTDGYRLARASVAWSPRSDSHFSVRVPGELRSAMEADAGVEADVYYLAPHDEEGTSGRLFLRSPDAEQSIVIDAVPSDAPVNVPARPLGHVSLEAGAIAATIAGMESETVSLLSTADALQLASSTTDGTSGDVLANLFGGREVASGDDEQIVVSMPATSQGAGIDAPEVSRDELARGLDFVDPVAARTAVVAYSLEGAGEPSALALLLHGEPDAARYYLFTAMGPAGTPSVLLPEAVVE